MQQISIADTVRQELERESIVTRTLVRIIPKKKLMNIDQIEVKNKFWMPSNSENNRDQKSALIALYIHLLIKIYDMKE